MRADVQPLSHAVAQIKGGAVIRLLVLDIETSPNLVYTWGLFNQNIGVNQIVKPTEMLCFSAKYVGKHKITFRSVHSDGREKMVRDLWDLLDDADVVVHYNGASFDVPHVQREFLEMELPPPSPFAQIDLYRAVKKRFLFPSKKLEFVVKELGIGEKLQTGGFELWRGCMDGEASAWRLMAQYNKADVAITELLYERIKPWIPNVPSHAAYDQAHVCPACGSDDLQSRGFAYTNQSKFQRYQCQSCGKWSRSTKGKTIDIREVAS